MSYLDDWMDARDERVEARLGTRTPRCSRPSCNETDPLALTGIASDIVCYECQAIERGVSPVEGHHPAGQHNERDDVLDLLGNDHRPVSDGQVATWPRETLRNPDGSPLLHAAAAIRGWLDVLMHVITRTVGWVPPFLEWLDAALRERIGPTWWTDLGGAG